MRVPRKEGDTRKDRIAVAANRTILVIELFGIDQHAIKLRFFGVPAYRRNDEWIPLPPAVALLYLLLVKSGYKVQRQLACEFLWPDAELTSSRHSLAQLSYRIRTAYSDIPVGAAGPYLQLFCEAPCSDLELFDRSSGDFRLPLHSGRSVKWDMQIAVGVEWSGSKEAMHWLENLRSTYRNKVRIALSAQMDRAAATGQWEVAKALAGCVLDLDSLDDAAHYIRAAALWAEGKTREARESVEESRVELLTEGGIPLRGRLLSLARKLTAAAGTDRPGKVRRHLVGRADEYSELMDRIASCHAGNGSVVTVSGEAGIGKTTLVTAVIDDLRARDIEILTIKCNSAERMAAGAGIAALLVQNSHALDLGRLGDAEHGALITIFPDLPRLRVERADKPIDVPPADLVSRVVIRAVASLLEDAAALRPVVLVVDDAQWLDALSAAAMISFGNRTWSMGTAVVFVCRTGIVDVPPESLRLMRETFPEDEPMCLRPLSFASFQELARLYPSRPGRLLEAVFAASGGIPLYAIEMLSEYRGDEQPESPAGHDKLYQVVHRRTSSLSGDAQLMWAAVVVAGTSVQVRTVGHVIDMNAARVLGAAQELREANLIVDVDGAVVPTHELLREISYAGIPSAQKAYLHSRFADYLLSEWPRNNEQIALHHAQAGAHSEAAMYALAAAKRQFSLGAYEDAARTAELATEHDPTGVGREAALVGARALVALGRSREAAARLRTNCDLSKPEVKRMLAFCDCDSRLSSLSDLEAVSTRAFETGNDAAAAGDYSLAAEMFSLLVDSLHENTSKSDIKKTLESLLQSGRGWPDTSAKSRLFRLAGTASLIYGTHTEARGHLERALAIARLCNDEIARYESQFGLAMSLVRAGDHAEAADMAGSVLRELDNRGLGAVREKFANNYAVILLEGGRAHAAGQELRKALAQASVHKSTYVAVNLCLSGILGVTADDVRLGFEALRKSVERRRANWVNLYVLTFRVWLLASRGDSVNAAEEGAALSQLLQRTRSLDDPSYVAMAAAWALNRMGNATSAEQLLADVAEQVRHRHIPAFVRLHEARQQMLGGGSWDVPFGRRMRELSNLNLQDQHSIPPAHEPASRRQSTPNPEDV